MNQEPVSEVVSNVIDAARKIDMWWAVLDMLNGYPKVQKEGAILHLDEARAELKVRIVELDASDNEGE